MAIHVGKALWLSGAIFVVLAGGQLLCELFVYLRSVTHVVIVADDSDVKEGDIIDLETGEVIRERE